MKTIDDFLAQDERKELLRLLTAGSVDDGKSTLIGRLLFDSKQIYDDQLQALTLDSAHRSSGEGIDYALLCDGLKAEREQGITIDVAYRYFATSRRKFIIADTPGHKQYTRNMITGGSTASLAIILVDARQGIVTQTRRHSYIVSLLGIEHIVLAVNKMDLIGYSERQFNNICAEYRQWLSEQNICPAKLHTIPISALHGDNIVHPSQNMEWYTAPALLPLLETIEIVGSRVKKPFRFPVQYVLRPNLDFRGFAGTVATGVIRRGDRVTVLPSGKSATIEQIVTYDGNLRCAFAPQSVTLTLDEQIDISRGDMIVRADESQPTLCNLFTAMVVWMDEQSLNCHKHFYIKHSTNTVRATFEQINYLVDVDSGCHYDSDSMTLNQIANVNIHCSTPLICDPYSKNRHTGSFIVIDPITNFTSAVGMIVSATGKREAVSPITTISLAACDIAAKDAELVKTICREISKQTGITIECIK